MSVIKHLRCVYSTTLHLLPDPNIQSILIFMNLIRTKVIYMYFSHRYFQIWAWISISDKKRMPQRSTFILVLDRMLHVILKSTRSW